MPKLIALYIDALDSNHIDAETTPNIHRWNIQGSLSELSTMFAFKGISAAMYAGVPPRESGVWMDFKVRETPDHKLGDRLLSVAARLPSGLPRKGAVVAYERLIRRSQVTPHIVPANLRPYFEAHPKDSISDDRPLGEIPTIFDLFRANQVSFETIGHAGGPQERIKKKMRTVDERTEDVVLLKLTLLDHIGHKYGPGSEEHDEALREVDEILGELVERTEGSEFLIFSDHGMQPVEGSVDIRTFLSREVGLVEEEDFVAFFNSTCALIRWLSPGVREDVQSAVRDKPDLRILRNDDLDRLSIGDTKEDFADDVIATEPRIVVSPDFYRRTPPQGMHGFTDNPNGGPVGIVPRKEVAKTGQLWDLAPTMLDQLSLESPINWEGSSLL